MGESGPLTATCIRVVPRPLSIWPWPASQHRGGTVIPQTMGTGLSPKTHGLFSCSSCPVSC